MREAFRNEALLLIRSRNSLVRWVTSNQVFRNCPPFILFTNQVRLSSAVYFKKLCEWLDLPQWRTEVNLINELELGVAEMKDKPDKFVFLQSFVFKCLESTLSLFSTSPEDCPTWLRAILRLPIFPVATRDGSKTIQHLGDTIFVPDSELLNPLFQGKVDILDFGENHIWDIIDILKCSKSGSRFISNYNNPTTMEIQIRSLVTKAHVT